MHDDIGFCVIIIPYVTLFMVNFVSLFYIAVSKWSCNYFV